MPRIYLSRSHNVILYKCTLFVQQSVSWTNVSSLFATIQLKKNHNQRWVRFHSVSFRLRDSAIVYLKSTIMYLWNSSTKQWFNPKHFFIPMSDTTKLHVGPTVIEQLLWFSDSNCMETNASIKNSHLWWKHLSDR